MDSNVEGEADTKPESTDCIPLLFCRGTYYEVGFQIGRNFRERIREYFSLFKDLHKKFVPFYKSKTGKEIIDNYMTVIKNNFPHYLKEMEGLSDGSEVPFQQVLLMHLRVELQTYMRKEQVPECSTIFVNTLHTCILAHNEDTSELVKNRGYLIFARIEEQHSQGKHQLKEETFLAYCYPGLIPGNAFSVNKHGFIFTVNALYPDIFQLGRTPRQFINRAVISGSSWGMIRKILIDEGDGISTGCSTNIAYMNKKDPDKRMWNFEMCPFLDGKRSLVSGVSISRAGEPIIGSYPGYYNHFNVYKHLQGVNDLAWRGSSSKCRQERNDELPLPQGLDDILAVLGDTANEDFPIYRIPRPTDIGTTVATAIFDLKKETLSVYVDNPKSSGPILKLNLYHLFKLYEP